MSGWYWQVDRPRRKPEVRVLALAVGRELPQLGSGVRTERRQPRKVMSTVPKASACADRARRSISATRAGFLVAVAGDATEIVEEIRGVRYAVGDHFGMLAMVLLLTTLFQVRFGLAPLKRISERVAAIRSGRASSSRASFRSRSRRWRERQMR